MDEKLLKERFFKFALSVIRLTEKFPNEQPYYVIKNQITKSSTSSAANYRAVCRARSSADFLNKLGVVEEELDETLFWLEFTEAVDSKWSQEIEPIYQEGNELLSIIVASIKTAKEKLHTNSKQSR